MLIIELELRDGFLVLPLDLLYEGLMCLGHLINGFVTLFLHPFDLLLILLLSFLDGLFGLNYAEPGLLQLCLLDLLKSALSLLLANYQLLLVSLLLPLDELLQVLILSLQSLDLGLQLAHLALAFQRELGQLLMQGIIVLFLQLRDLVTVLLFELLELEVRLFLGCAIFVLEVLSQV